MFKQIDKQKDSIKCMNVLTDRQTERQYKVHECSINVKREREKIDRKNRQTDIQTDRITA
jgi:hypothetical protein